MSDLEKRRCQSCEGIGNKFNQDEIKRHMKMINKDWKYDKKSESIHRDFKFKNYYEVFAFANAVAWVSHYEDHHPEMIVNYADCRVSYSTHALGGLTENDFICASKIDRLLDTGVDSQ